jgi:CBS domain-containing protein
MHIHEVLRTKGDQVVTVSPETTVRDLIATLAEHNIGAVVVIDAARAPVGILSERDLVREATHDRDFLSRTVGETMTREITCGSPADDVDAVLHTMTNGHFRHLPITEHGALIGVVSLGDLVKAQLNQYKGDLDTLQTQLMDR